MNPLVKNVKSVLNNITMEQQIISQIDNRIKAITDLEIEAINNSNKHKRISLNQTKIELLELKIFISNLALENIRKQLNA